MRITISDIAKAVDVNVGTVSRALNGKPGVSPDLRKKITRKAEELHYRPSGHARGLVTKRAETIGLISGAEPKVFLSDPFYAEIFSGIEAETREHNYALMFASAGWENPMGETPLPKFILERRVDGLLLVGVVEPHIVQQLQEMNYPFVMVDFHLPDKNTDTVITNNTRGARLATEYLIRLGHRRIGFVGGTLDMGNFYERLQGYCEGLQSAGIAYRQEMVQGGEKSGGFESTLKILDHAPDITAIVACNDANALGAMRALRVRGLEVPTDVSVIGFDDIPAASESWPPLTTMRVDKWTMGRQATKWIMQKLQEHELAAPHEVVFCPELVVRESAAAPKSA